MAKEIFISYSRKDFDRVKAIKDEIDREVGIDCWMDLDGVESGDLFKKVIIKAINEHDTMLFMLSANSMASTWAMDELNFAKYKGKRVVLVYIEPCTMSDEFYFDFHKYDTIDWNNPLQHNKLLDNIRSWFNLAPQKPTPIQNTHPAPTPVSQANPNYYGYLEFEYNATLKRAMVKGVGTTGGDIVIPPITYLNSIKYDVTEIMRFAFSDCDGITSIIIPDSVKHIHMGAFKNCRHLESVHLPSGISEIEDYTFQNCGSLVEINIPEGVQRIGDCAFHHDRSLTKVTLPSSVKSIEMWAFRDCARLEDINIPKGVTSIGNGAFSDCHNLRRVDVPAAADIAANAFPNTCQVH